MVDNLYVIVGISEIETEYTSYTFREPLMITKWPRDAEEWIARNKEMLSNKVEEVGIVLFSNGEFDWKNMRWVWLGG